MHKVEQEADDICLSHRRKLQAPAMDPAEVVLPQLLQHVREREQELQGDCVLWQGRRVSDLAHQAVLIDNVKCQFAFGSTAGCGDVW